MYTHPRTQLDLLVASPGVVARCLQLCVPVVRWLNVLVAVTRTLSAKPIFAAVFADNGIHVAAAVFPLLDLVMDKVRVDAGALHTHTTPVPPPVPPPPRTHMHTRTHTCTCTCTHMHAYSHTYTHTHIHAHTYMHINTYTHTHTHTHVESCL
jgi:hypothetical protein